MLIKPVIIGDFVVSFEANGKNYKLKNKTTLNVFLSILNNKNVIELEKGFYIF